MNYQEEGSISMPMVVYLDGEEKYRAMRYDPEKQSQAFMLITILISLRHVG